MVNVNDNEKSLEPVCSVYMYIISNSLEFLVCGVLGRVQTAAQNEAAKNGWQLLIQSTNIPASEELIRRVTKACLPAHSTQTWHCVASVLANTIKQTCDLCLSRLACPNLLQPLRFNVNVCAFKSMTSSLLQPSDYSAYAGYNPSAYANPYSYYPYMTAGGLSASSISSPPPQTYILNTPPTTGENARPPVAGV